MPRYAVLPRASANRVYGGTGLQLARAELELVGATLFAGLIEGVTEVRLGGVDYLEVACTREPDPFALAVLSNLSSLHALFAREDDVLRPVEVAARATVDDDVTTIQRYVGKTNEQFTHLLVNATMAAAGDAFARLFAGEPVRLLDPVCGRGTSLNRAIVYGLDAYGVELDRKAFDAYASFIGTWLKEKRLKHRVEEARLRRGREAAAHRLSISYGEKGGDVRRVIDVTHDDTVRTAEHVKRGSIDVVVADLPYGVQHGGRSTAEALVEAALAGWVTTMRPGGAMGLAWNLRTLPRARLTEVVTAAGLVPAQATDDEAFVHRVDRSITRDVLVAVRP